MIVLSNSTAQTLAPGQSLVFDRKIMQAGCGECHRANTSSVKMRFHGDYLVAFSGNISAGVAATPVQLAIEASGSILPETTMISETVIATDVNNVATMTAVKNCCGDYDRLTVTNTGTNNVTVSANSSFVVMRDV